MLNADQSARMSQLALRWTMLTMVRSKDTCFAEWSELENIGGANPLWRIPYQRMKPRYERLVPLSRQALRLLEELSSFNGALTHRKLGRARSRDRWCTDG